MFDEMRLRASINGVSRGGRMERALQVLDLLTTHNNGKLDGQESHARLIQSCLQNLREPKPSRTDHSQALNDEPSNSNLNANAVSRLLSNSSGEERDRSSSGLHLHAVSVKAGLDRRCPVASALISFYAKTSRLRNARQVFDETPDRSTASWTAIIAGYAQKLRTEEAMELALQMNRAGVKPNDYTLSALVSACGSAGCLQPGKSFHCQALRAGFSSHTHVSNSLISMYAKCGSIADGASVFYEMGSSSRDLISWNSMISACALHGLSEMAMAMASRMQTRGVSPDCVTFLAILSSCRHGGMVELARNCFSSMQRLGLRPELGHYSSMVDLLARAGRVEEALEFIENMPIPPNSIIWGSLLSSCRTHRRTRVGIRAAERRLELEPGCAATHVQLASLYAAAGDWRRAAAVRKKMKDGGVKTEPGFSWTEVSGRVHLFRAEDGFNPSIVSVLDSLFDQMRCDHQ